MTTPAVSHTVLFYMGSALYEKSDLIHCCPQGPSLCVFSPSALMTYDFCLVHFEKSLSDPSYPVYGKTMVNVLQIEGWMK